MPVNQQTAMRMVGRPVQVHHVDGTIHRGILHSVSNDGIYLRQMGAGYASSTDKDALVHHANNSETSDAELAFWPFFFLPWLAIAALSPWGWWW